MNAATHDEGLVLATADLGQEWVEELRAAIETTLESSDPDGPHRVRAAIARLRVWLDLGGRGELQPELRRLRRRAGRVRDLDVQLAQRPPRRWRERLRLRRARRNDELSSTLRSKRTRRLLDALAQQPPISRQAALTDLHSIAWTAWKDALDLRDSPDQLARVRVLRRHVRKLRFALEWAGRSTSTLVALQRALGEVGDRSAALEDLPGGRPRRSLRRFRDKLERKRRSALAAASAAVLAALPALEALTIARDDPRCEAN